VFLYRFFSFVRLSVLIARSPEKSAYLGQRNIQIIHKLNIGMFNYEDLDQLADEQVGLGMGYNRGALLCFILYSG
jgi:hypothetical protein